LGLTFHFDWQKKRPGSKDIGLIRVLAKDRTDPLNPRVLENQQVLQSSERLAGKKRVMVIRVAAMTNSLC
jgi:hypothetical protein